MFEPNNVTGKRLLFDTNSSMTVTDAIGGGLSGTFTGTEIDVGPVITDGVFTDARL